jgi:hypothetical protein
MKISRYLAAAMLSLVVFRSDALARQVRQPASGQGFELSFQLLRRHAEPGPARPV